MFKHIYFLSIYIQTYYCGMPFTYEYFCKFAGKNITLQEEIFL